MPRAYRVHITHHARDDIDGALSWLGQHISPSQVELWLQQLYDTIDTLESYPLRCTTAPETADIGIEIRQLQFGNRRGVYRILFLIEGNHVHILRIRHAARKRLTHNTRDD